MVNAKGRPMGAICVFILIKKKARSTYHPNYSDN